MISLFGLGDISPQQRDIATATSHVVRDIATAASHGMISVQIICPTFLKSYHAKSLRFSRHHTQLPFEMVPIFHTVFARVYHYAISELCQGLYHHNGV